MQPELNKNVTPTEGITDEVELAAANASRKSFDIQSRQYAIERAFGELFPETLPVATPAADNAPWIIAYLDDAVIIRKNDKYYRATYKVDGDTVVLQPQSDWKEVVETQEWLAKAWKVGTPKTPHKSSTAIEFGSPLPILEMKSEGDDWEVSGYVSIFDTIDLGNDIVRPGAFTKSLKSGRKTRFLFSHDPRAVLGVPKELKEDSKGLFGRFKISKTRLGEETHQLLKDGAIDSFSFGYAAADYNYIDGDVRELKTIDLYEASLVAMPMHPSAIVTNFKEYLSLVDQSKSIAIDLDKFFNELRGLTDKNRPLSETKRKELTELLDTLSGLDAVRSNITVLLTATKPAGLVSSKLIAHQMAEARKRLANILRE